MFTRLSDTRACYSSPPGYKWIEVYESISGWKPVTYWLSTEEPGLVEPWDVLKNPEGPYHSKAEAEKAAYWWAAELALPFYLPDFHSPNDPLTN